MKLALILWLAHALPQPVADPMCLATTVYLEARDQSELGQRAIAEVALRRRDSGVWGASICSVVTAPGQFAMATLSPEHRLGEPMAAVAALRVAVSSARNWSQPAGRRQEIVPGANSFELRSIAQSRTPHARIVAVIGDHAFYRAGTLAQR
ncbi:MAG TPA: cell wall hydrolase [Xanthomonadaceae bacterium]|jgi:spore germination cell wall hydrolase CwlJ-like protein|nr:cell wall hydrolase [Xanthomonadaceae bacterium]